MMKYLWLVALLAAATASVTTVQGFSASSVPFQGKQNQDNEDKSSSSTSTTSGSHQQDDSFLFRHFNNVVDASDIDDNNCSPSLKSILKNIRQLTHQGSDIRGRFVDHPRVGRISRVSKAIELAQQDDGIPALTPFVAFCLGHAFGRLVLDQATTGSTTVAIGRDPRPHGSMLCDAFARGVQSVDDKIRVVYTGIATTPSMFHFCR
jgi:Phosphoglucomutase/phosphomannomutase, alpha/beta/alpha domain I